MSDHSQPSGLLDITSTIRSTPEHAIAEKRADDERAVRHAIERGFDTYGQFQETVAPEDLVRVERLGRIGREIASERGATVGTSAVSRRDGCVQVCLWLSTETEPD